MIRKFNGFVKNNLTDEIEPFKNLKLIEIARIMIKMKKISILAKNQYNAIVASIRTYCPNKWEYENEKINRRFFFCGKPASEKRKEIPSLTIELREVDIWKVI